LFVAATFFVIYKEHLKKKHLIGMILMISAVVLIMFGSEKPKSNTTIHSLSPMIPILLALLECVFYTISSL
jgi:drug/metabolite transporter (DMT)-like permease